MLREFECPLLPLADLPEVPDTQTDQSAADELDAEAARLASYRERLEKELRVAEEKTRIEQLLARRASSRPRPPAFTRDNEVTWIRPIPTAARAPVREEQEEYARPIMAGRLTSPMRQAPVQLASPRVESIPEPWSDASAMSDGAITIDRSRLGVNGPRAKHATLVPVFGVALALLLAAFVTRGEERSAAIGSFASAAAEQTSVPARLEAPARVEAAAASVAPAPIAIAAPAPSAKRANARRTTRPVTTTASAPAPAADVAVEPAPPSPAAATPAAATISAPDLEQAARTAKMLRAQLDGVVE